ncbi:hypothetical protein [Neoroseomonas terrae]|nr:hypothetical protein [Neoroseomonas terrae]
MEKIDAKILGMVSVTLLTRLTGHLEREGGVAARMDCDRTA